MQIFFNDLDVSASVGYERFKLGVQIFLMTLMLVHVWVTSVSNLGCRFFLMTLMLVHVWVTSVSNLGCRFF